MEITRITDVKELQKAAGKALGNLLAHARGEPVLLLLSGGSALDMLSYVEAERLGSRMTIGMLDERFDRDPAANNFLQLRQKEFYGRAREVGVRFIESIPTEGESLDRFADRIESAWKEWRKEHKDGAVIITQGMGEDGHTAGVMPLVEDSALFAQTFVDTERMVVGYDAGGKNAHPKRITATLAFLKREVNAAVAYIAGEAKQSAFNRLMAETGELAETPARIVRDMKDVRIFTDRADGVYMQSAKAPIPTSIVIFGITGDLASRKLIPALWHLFVKGYLPDEFSIVGFARRQWSDDEARAYVKEVLKEKMASATPETIERFLKRISYVSGDFGDADAYRHLADALSAIDERVGMCGAKLLHLAVPPNLYEGIFERLHASGLADMCGGLGGWTRILVEKPFGNDWYSAERLDQKLGSLFREEQIFRVDHYLGKEAVQNILVFRFSNALLEHLWDRTYVERVHIRLFETLGLEGRGAFYDSVGALRDVGQNHILQMLAFIAMEDPGEVEAGAIRDARARVLESLRPVAREEMPAMVKRAQYTGFLDEPNVKPDSTTETYFRVEAHIDNDRWQGVPFVLESGKKLGASKAEIEIVFRKKESCFCPPEQELRLQNTLVFRIQPHEGIALTFFAKHPGFEMKLEPKVLSFSYDESEEMRNAPDAYERVIFDCIRGDQTLFASTREELGSWKFITPIIEQWDAVPIGTYNPGWVPEQ